MISPTNDAKANSGKSTAQAVQSLMHFARVVRARRNIVIGAVAAGLLLSVLYHLSATRYYQARASLLVLQTGGDVSNTSMTPEGTRQGLMPTYERLFSQAVVLEGALDQLEPADRVDFAGLPRELCAQALRANLAATTARQTNIIEISYRSKSPRAATAVINAVVKSYLAFLDRTHKGTAGEIIQVLVRDKLQVEKRLTETQKQLVAARRRYGDLNIRSDSHVAHPYVQRVISLNEALVKAQQKRLEIAASRAAIRGALQRGEDLAQHVLAMENAVGREFILGALGFGQRDVTTLAAMEKTLLEEQAQLRTLSEYYLPRHPRVTAVQDRIKMAESYIEQYQAKIDKRMRETRQNQLGPMLLQMVDQKLAEAVEHEGSLRSNFESARQHAIDYTTDLERLEILKHDVDFLRQYRDALITKIASTDLKQEHGDIRTAVVSEPIEPKAPVWPRLSYVLVVGLGLSLGLGFGAVYVLDILDDRFRTPEELSAQLNAPILAMVRQMQASSASGIDAIRAHAMPDAVESEAFRTLRTTLAFSGRDTSRLILSSSEPGDGKTTVTANLAASIAHSGKRTLLIDADMRRPGLTTLLGLKGRPGLGDLLAGAGDVGAEATARIVATGIENLDVVPAGPRRANPSELLSGSRMVDLLAWAESRYDQILVDSPPILAAADSGIIGRLVDGLVLVVSPQKNQRRLVMRATDSLANVGVSLLGVVVNRITSDKDHGYGYGYGYGYEYKDAVSDPVDPPSAKLAIHAPTPSPTNERKQVA